MERSDMAKITKKETACQPISKDNSMLFQYLYEEAEKIISHNNVAINHTPVVDMFSTHDSIIIEIELPGVRQDEVDISILRSTLTIRGLKYECFDEKKVNFVCMERSFGRLFRVIDIPYPVDTSVIKAVFRDGLLTITLSRIEEKRGVPRKINVES
ncbi:MAG: Hsp20/alpha crystallin family protein [Deltaproteobacteria bacterium]|nr:Hsp20/alpha crystallin family protein [Deltaproteobacteria bacterium]